MAQLLGDEGTVPMKKWMNSGSVISELLTLMLTKYWWFMVFAVRVVVGQEALREWRRERFPLGL